MKRHHADTRIRCTEAPRHIHMTVADERGCFCLVMILFTHLFSRVPLCMSPGMLNMPVM